MKFGGSSVGSPESLKMVKQIIEKENEPVIVVVSALSGVTDRLLLAADFALNNNPGYKSLLEEIIKRHEEIIEKMILSAEIREEVTQKIQQLLDDLRNILRGVYLIGDLSQKTSDKIVSYGERLSSLIISYVIGDAELYDPMHFIKTSRQFHNHLPDLARCNQLIRKTFSEMPPRRWPLSRFHCLQQRERRHHHWDVAGRITLPPSSPPRWMPPYWKYGPTWMAL